jgi:hypothetical protein
MSESKLTVGDAGLSAQKTGLSDGALLLLAQHMDINISTSTVKSNEGAMVDSVLFIMHFPDVPLHA